jgi:phosphonate transport system substrate-binding protein
VKPALMGALDRNLGFPCERPDWAAFFAAQNCAISATTDLPALTEDLRRHRLDFAYVPAATCFFVRSDPAYRGVASALSARNKTPDQASVLIVKRESPAERWQDLRGARFGFVNRCCTTTYFAPAMLMAGEGGAVDKFFNLVVVGVGQGQIDAVIAGEVDVTMVYEDSWLARPENAEQTKVLARLNALPTPAFLVRSDVDAAFASELKTALLAYTYSVNDDALYVGFVDYQDDLMQRFFADVERVADFL